jgi:phage gp16-like protein
MLQSARCRRATQEGSQFCRRHRYLDRVRSKKMVEALQLQPEAKLTG